MNYQGNNYNGTTLALGGTTVVNDGTLILDAQGSGTKSGGPATVNDGALRNNGVITAEVSDPSWSVGFAAGLTNTRHGLLTISGGTFADSGGGATVTNDGTIKIAPRSIYSLDAGTTLLNKPDGLISLEIASTTSLGQFQLTAPCCSGPGKLVAGGTLDPTLTGGRTPGAGAEYQVVLLDGGAYSGTFAHLAKGFTTDSSHETTSPAYVGVVYGKHAGSAKSK